MKPTLIFLCLILSFEVFCQNQQSDEIQKDITNHLFGVRIGLNDFHIRDEYLSPHIFAKTMFSSEVYYQICASRFIHEFNISFSTGHPYSKQQPRDVTQKMGSFSYSITHMIAEEYVKGRPLQFSLGTGITSFIANADYISRDLKNSYEWNEQSWYCSNSINMLVSTKYLFTLQRNILIQFRMPLFSLVSRPEDGHVWSDANTKVINKILKAEGQGKPEIFWKSPVIFSDIEYKQPLGKQTSIIFVYKFDYFYSPRPLPVKMYMNQFMIGFEFNN